MSEVIERNKVIARFMGFEDASRIVGGGPYMRRKTKWQFGCQQYEEHKYEDLKYHTDWNLLIEVYHKLLTQVWGAGVSSNEFFNKFSDCVARNAPLTASKLLAEEVKTHLGYGE